MASSPSPWSYLRATRDIDSTPSSPANVPRPPHPSSTGLPAAPWSSLQEPTCLTLDPCGWSGRGAPVCPSALSSDHGDHGGTRPTTAQSEQTLRHAEEQWGGQQPPSNLETGAASGHPRGTCLRWASAGEHRVKKTWF